jgi:hypothetical protein
MQHLDGLLYFLHLEDQSILNVDSAGTGSAKVCHQSFVGRGLLVRILGQQIEQGLGLLLPPGPDGG